MKKHSNWIIVVLLFLFLIVIRGYIAPHLYDPLNIYFKRDYLYNELPPIELDVYFSHLFLRYLLNSGISIAIIYFIFMKKNVVLFSIKFYTFSFLLLSLTLFTLLKLQPLESYMPLFYVRRFLIHPIFLLLLIPAFYYQQIQLKLKK